MLRTYAAHWRLLIPLAALILLPQAVADATIGEIEVERVKTSADVLKLAAIPLSIAVNLGGEALLAGIVAAAVLHWRRGETLSDLRTAAKEITYGRLIAIDLLLAAGFAIGLVLLIVPGVLFVTYLLISPALIEINRISIREALSKSIELTRGNFWRVFVFAMGFFLVTDVLYAVLEAPVHGLALESAFNLAIEAAVEPIQALATVLLALALMDLRREPLRA